MRAPGAPCRPPLARMFVLGDGDAPRGCLGPVIAPACTGAWRGASDPRVGRKGERMTRTVAALSLIVAAAAGGVAAVPAPAMAAGTTANLTLDCNTGTCTGSWQWYQGGTSGTLLSSGSISGADSTTRGTTVQPATADTVVIGLEQPAGKEACGTSQTDSFSPGSHLNVTAKLREHADAYHFGCFDTFSMNS